MTTVDLNPLRTARLTHDPAYMTPEALAEKSGVHVNTVRYIENGKQKPSEETLRKLCSAFTNPKVEPGLLLLAIFRAREAQARSAEAAA